MRAVASFCAYAVSRPALASPCGAEVMIEARNPGPAPAVDSHDVSSTLRPAGRAGRGGARGPLGFRDPAGGSAARPTLAGKVDLDRRRSRTAQLLYLLPQVLR